MNEDDRTAFMNLFDVVYRPAVSTFFFNIIRTHDRSQITKKLLCSKILEKVKADPHDKDTVTKMYALFDVIEDANNRGTIAKYLDFLYAWDRLTPNEKAKLKSKRGIDTPEAKERMSKVQPSERQLSYLSSLGYKGDPPANMTEASTLIEQYKKKI